MSNSQLSCSLELLTNAKNVTGNPHCTCQYPMFGIVLYVGSWVLHKDFNLSVSWILGLFSFSCRNI